ncbi:Asp23/Gls24 family envelope stress response protein [Micromonospora sp. CPCC 206061]|uniref:Asp23/Gls24 family envelope stress response protein n=1 Tax=Micromonospora sp. CPCC 206061 TaxID=3122410 RepID=UPI002FF1126A
MTDVAAHVPTQQDVVDPPVSDVVLAPTPVPVTEQVSDAVERAAVASGRVASQVVERLRNNAELAAERGTTKIADEVVEKIAGIAARDVPGVYDLGGDVARFFASVKERIGLGEADDDADRGMSVRLEGRSAVVNITLVIEYGFVVHSVTEAVRAKVISAVENLLGLDVTEVNILVDDVHVEDTGPVGDDEARAADYQ